MNFVTFAHMVKSFSVRLTWRIACHDVATKNDSLCVTQFSEVGQFAGLPFCEDVKAMCKINHIHMLIVRGDCLKKFPLWETPVY